MTVDGSAATPPPAGADGSGFTAVIADDDPDIAALMGVAVRRAGGTVLAVAHDGSGALDEIVRLRPDLALLDVAMPGITGVEVCRQVREGAGGTPGSGGKPVDTVVILLSAAVHPEAVQRGLEAGAHSYLAKPFSPRSLAAHLGQAIQERGSRS